MKQPMLHELVTILPSYTSEVNVGMDFDNPELNAEKVRGYIPTAGARSAVGSIISGLTPISTKRVHLVTGTYGTGKSHFGLVLANLFGQPHGSDVLEPFMARLREKDPHIADIVSRNRAAIPQRFLIVIVKPTSDPDGFNHALLSALQTALRNAGIEYEPKTHFTEAAKILEVWTQKPETNEQLERELRRYRTDVRILAANLRNIHSDAYQIFSNIYQSIAFLPFRPEHYADPVEVFADTAKHIRASGSYAGILVVADEFGGYLTELARDPESRESRNIQQFLEFCKRTREDQVHCLVIAHQTLADYAAGHRSKADWEKVYGRFLENEYNLNVAGGEFEIVDMIDVVINVCADDAQLDDLWKDIKGRLSALKDWIRNYGLFAARSEEWIQQNLLEGCYPLHPASTFCVPWLAQRIGQANRTAFKFLESREPGGLNEFIGSASVFTDQAGLNLYTPDKLLTYFGYGAREKAQYRPVMQAWETARAEVAAGSLSARLIDLLAVIEIVGQPMLRPTRDVLASLLGTTRLEEEEVEKLLDTLVDQRVIRFRSTSGRYELPRRGLGEIDAHEAIMSLKERLREEVDLVGSLKARRNLTPIVAGEYEKEYGMPRSAARELVSPRHLGNLEVYRERVEEQYRPGRTAYQGDALILYVVAQSNAEIDAALDRLMGGTGSDQLIVGVPKQPFTAGELVLDLAAATKLRAMGLKVAEGTVDAADLEQAESDRTTMLEQALNTYFAASNFDWYYGSNVLTAGTSRDEQKLISTIMFALFDKTPRVVDEAVIVIGRDMQRRHRSAAMQRLLEVEGPVQVMRTGGQAYDRILRRVLRDTELLEKKRDLGKVDEFELRLVAPERSPLAEIWTYLRKQVTQPEKAIRLDDIVGELLAPPYGLTSQLIEILFAAALRTVKDQCVVFGNVSKLVQSNRLSDATRVPLVAANVSAMVTQPEDYVLLYYEVLPSQKAFLNEIIATLQSDAKPTDPGGLWERAKDALVGWFAELPIATQHATDLSPFAAAMVRLFRDEEKLRDAKRLLSIDLPEVLGVHATRTWDDSTSEQLRTVFRTVYEELENHIQTRVIVAVEQLCTVFDTSGRTLSDFDKAARSWYSSLSEYQRMHRFSGDPGFLIEAIRGSGEVIDRFLVHLPEEMSYPRYTEWVELGTIEDYVRRVKLAKQQVETWAPPVASKHPGSSGGTNVQAQSLQAQICSLLIGSGLSLEEQIQVLNDVLEAITP